MQATLNVTEMFYSLQGEGARAGEASVFIRLQGCKTKHACFANGIMCDTEFESGREMTMGEILLEVRKLTDYNRSVWLVWTGGEPLDQLANIHIDYMYEAGYEKQALETSGLVRLPMNHKLSYVAVSPKVAEHVLLKNFQGESIDELRYVCHSGQSIPKPSITAKHYYLSPHSDANRINAKNLLHCVVLCKQNPQWRLSVQQHKVWGVL